VARELFVAGARAAHEERWTQAHEAFSRSFALYPRPLTLLNLAAAQAHVGRLADAVASYRRFLREASDPAEVQQRGAAQAALDALEPRVPRVRFTFSGLHGDETYTLDGSPLAGTALASEVPVNPGEHRLAVLRGAAEVGEATFTAAERTRRTVRVEVGAVRPSVDLWAGRAHPVATPAGGERGTEGEPRRRGLLTRWWFWTAVGVVVAGGTAAAIVAASGTDDPWSGNVPPGVLEVP
jgi:hypothetical protein